MSTVMTGLKAAFEGRGYRAFGALTFAMSLALYLMTLPASFTGGRIGFNAMRYLDFELVAFSAVMAALVALLLPTIVFQVRRGRRASKASAAGGVAVGVLTPLLCCSPALPIALGFVATVFPSLAGAAGGWLQGFIATHKTELFTVASILLAVAVYQNARSVARGPSCAVSARRSPAATGTPARDVEPAPVSGEGAPP